jgi:hypothetical protein
MELEKLRCGKVDDSWCMDRAFTRNCDQIVRHGSSTQPFDVEGYSGWCPLARACLSTSVQNDEHPVPSDATLNVVIASSLPLGACEWTLPFGERGGASRRAAHPRGVGAAPSCLLKGSARKLAQSLVLSTCHVDPPAVCLAHEPSRSN